MEENNSSRMNESLTAVPVDFALASWIWKKIRAMGGITESRQRVADTSSKHLADRDVHIPHCDWGPASIRGKAHWSVCSRLDHLRSQKHRARVTTLAETRRHTWL